MKVVIWDWNGTLLDDVQVCIDSMNIVLKQHKLPAIKSIIEYQSLFKFPVNEYYLALGFDFKTTPFENLAVEFMEIYNSLSKNCSLNKDVQSILEEISSRDISQLIISASKESNLKCQVNSFHIENNFKGIYGISDIFAKSKYELIKMVIEQNCYDISEVMMVGDTLHDYEIAKKIGCMSLLYKNGHQELRLTNMEDVIIINELNEVFKYIN